MNWYRLELGTKVYECFERVTKCTEDGCREVPAAPQSLGPRPPGGQLSLPRWVWVQLPRGLAEQVGAGSPSAEFHSVFGVFLQIKMSWFFWLRFIPKTGPRPRSKMRSRFSHQRPELTVLATQTGRLQPLLSPAAVSGECSAGRHRLAQRTLRVCKTH